MSSFDENANVERMRQEDQPKRADEIKRALTLGYHLKCLRCGSTYYHTEFAMAEMSYRMYSYCPNCIDEGIKALKEQKPVKPIFDELDVCGRCGNCGHSLTHQEKFGDNVLVETRYDYCPACGKKVAWDD